jgi:hypothetical protein
MCTIAPSNLHQLVFGCLHLVRRGDGQNASWAGIVSWECWQGCK